METYLIWIIVLLYGVFMGNFATSAVFRLPRGIPLFGIAERKGVPPHCSTCGHTLRMWEYFPIIGWIMCRGHCRYCGVAIPPVYFMVEAAMTLFSIFAYLAYGFGELYIITVLCLMALVTQTAIYLEHRKTLTPVVVAIAFTGVMMRLLATPELFPLMASAVLVWLVGRFLLKNETAPESRLPLLALMLAVGACLSFTLWPVFWVALVLIACVAFLQSQSLLLGMAAPVAAIVAILWPGVMRIASFFHFYQL